MSFPSSLDAALQSPIVDRLCVPVTYLSAWVIDGTGLRLMLAWMVISLAGQAMTRATGHHVPAPVALRHTVAGSIRRLWVVAYPYLGRGSHRIAAKYAGWLDAHEMPQTAARVRVINGLIPAV